jgi:hypothetical protein
VTIQPIHFPSTARDGLSPIEPVHRRRKVADEHEHEEPRDEGQPHEQPEHQEQQPPGESVVDADGHVDVLA